LVKNKEAYLLGELEGTINMVNGHEKVVERLAREDISHQEKIAHSVSPNERYFWLVQLQQIDYLHEEEVKKMTDLSAEEANTEVELMEQLFITQENKEELEAILKKPDGHSVRVIVDAMKGNKIDEQIYHNGAILRNQCMKFGEKREEIVNEITEETKQSINCPQHVAYLDAFNASLKSIIYPWQKITRAMKSVNRQTTTAIAQFKLDTISLNKAIHKFVTEEPVPGMKIELSSFL